MAGSHLPDCLIGSELPPWILGILGSLQEEADDSQRWHNVVAQHCSSGWSQLLLAKDEPWLLNGSWVVGAEASRQHSVFFLQPQSVQD